MVITKILILRRYDAFLSFHAEETDAKIAFVKVFVDFIADMGVQKLKQLNLSKKIERVENEISKSEQYRLIAQNSSDMISLIDADFSFIYISPSCKKIAGYAQNEIIGSLISDYIHPEDLSLCMNLQDKMQLNKDDLYSVTFRLRKKNGSYIWVETMVRPIFDRKTGKLTETLCSMRDVSERIKMNEDLIAAKIQADQANATKSEFLANMSHEIRTPLNAVIGFSELLGATDLGAKQASYVEAINTAGKSLLMLINDILDLSKIEAGRMEIHLAPTSIKSVFSELEQIFVQKIRSKNIEMTLDVDPNLPPALLLDETRLRQVLLNLIGNAIKFTDNGGVTLRLEKSYTDITDGSRLNLKISVIDTGIGIPREEYDNIFQSFKQQTGQSNRKYGGTGLGLTITKNLVEMMGGTISVSSTVGQGSTFTVALNNVDVAASASLPSEGQSCDFDAAQFKKATVLVVDDVPSNRLLIKEILTNRGLSIITAENGHEAVIIAGEMLPDVVLMDVRMPVMDGIEAYKKLKADENTKHIPVIALTASVFEGKSSSADDQLFDGFLAKPISVRQLMDELKKYLTVQAPAEDKEAEPVLPAPEPSAAMPDDLIVMLTGDLLPLCEKLSAALKISNAKKLAALLDSIGKQHKQPVLSDYAKNIMDAIESFDIESLKATVHEVSAYLESFIAEKNNV